MATLQKRIEDLARQVALDQIAQDIDNEQKFARKDDVVSTEAIERLMTLEGKVARLIRICWVQEEVKPLTLQVSDEANNDPFLVRLSSLEEKVSELIEKNLEARSFLIFKYQISLKQASQFCGVFFLDKSNGY